MLLSSVAAVLQSCSPCCSLFASTKRYVKFSIITPSFHQLPYLKLCIRSVDDQRILLEHLIQDAGTGPELDRWVTKHSSAELFVEKDEGMYDAINRGFSRAQGEICAWLNCDEQYLPGTLARVEQFFAQHPEVDVLFGDAVLLDGAGSILSYRRAILPRRSHVRYVHLNTLSCATFFRRRLFEQGHRFDPQWKAIGDAVWMYGLLSANKVMAVIPEPLATFAFTGENLSASLKAQKEARCWRGNHWRNATVPFLSLSHRFHKWLAGAYRRRNLAISIYTLESPNQRKEVNASDVGYAWQNVDPRKVDGPQGR
ncbi:MAG: glycosyltransferase [Verrucomicrobiaceae bacterium]|nr:MAG: glycosyltransferase [Verrucomicrobiaceae bacterium]